MSGLESKSDVISGKRTLVASGVVDSVQLDPSSKAHRMAGSRAPLKYRIWSGGIPDWRKHVGQLFVLKRGANPVEGWVVGIATNGVNPEVGEVCLSEEILAVQTGETFDLFELETYDPAIHR